MTTEQAQEKIKMYVEIYFNIVKKAVISKEMDGLTAGRIALRVLNCPENVIDFIEKSMIKQLNSL